MSLSKSLCWYSNNCLYFIKCAIPLFTIFKVRHSTLIPAVKVLSYKSRGLSYKTFFYRGVIS